MSHSISHGLLAATGLAAVAATLLAGTPAAAGQPWHCLCDGEPKRFIASSYACEHDLHKGKGMQVSSGFRLFVPRCTRAQFRDWQASACRARGCEPPRSRQR